MSLRSLCVDRTGRLFAAGDSQIKMFDPEGTLRDRWPTSKPVHAVAVDDNGRVWAGEQGQIEIFDPKTRRASVWSDAQNLAEITAIGFHAADVFVADARERCVRRFDRQRKLLAAIGQNNRTRGFLIPNGVLEFRIDGAGVIHAANPGKHRVERYSASGELLGHIGRFDGIDPEGFHGCCNPTNLAIHHGRVYVTEKAGPRAKVLSGDGKLIAVIATDAFHPTCRNMPVAVDSRGRVYVADTVELRILAFDEVAS